MRKTHFTADFSLSLVNNVMDESLFTIGEANR